ncbi:MAG: metallophosphoesterase [Thermoproteota archaeon]|nr:metallophosphoesterase [Candidatus Brockarchaeota archaeon]
MKIGVLADTHVGRRIPIEIGELRRRAYRHAFTQSINIFIEEGVDYVIHAGDLFEKRSMTSEDSVFVKEEFQRLVNSIKEKHGKEVSIFVVRGNHDGSYDNNALDFVKHPLAKYLKVVGESLVRGEEEFYVDGEIMLTGMPYHTYVSRVFKEVRPLIEKLFKTEDYFKIFLVHNFIQGHHDIPPGTPPHNFLSIKDFEGLGVNIVIAGHFHTKAGPLEEKGIIFLTPGATEAVDLSDEGPFGVYILEPGVKPRFVKIRPLHEIRNSKVDSMETVKPKEWYVENVLKEANAYCSYLREKKADGLLRIVISGYLEEGDPSIIDLALREELSELKSQTGLLYVDLVNRVEELPQKIAFPKMGTGLDYMTTALKPLGENIGEAMSLIEEISMLLEEKASQKTGLLTGLDRSRFVKRWLEIFEKRDVK